MTKKPKQDKKYKDAYSSKEYESQEKFLAMKLSHTKTNFTKLYQGLYKVVQGGKKENVVNVEKLGLETMDARLPRYVLGFIKGGKEYKVKFSEKVWGQLTLTKK